MFSYSKGSVTVRWLNGGLWIESLGDALLLDAPPGCVDRISGGLAMLRGVVLTSGRLGSVGGLVALLASSERERLPESALVLQTPPGDDRSVLLAESWMRGWPGSYPLLLDTVTAGNNTEIGRFSIETVKVQHGEPRWLPTERIEAVSGVAMRVEIDGVSVAWIAGTSVSNGAQALVSGVDLAVVEVGVTPWPRSQRRWRMTVAEALQLTTSAAQSWLVGDDGAVIGGGEC